MSSEGETIYAMRSEREGGGKSEKRVSKLSPASNRPCSVIRDSVW